MTRAATGGGLEPEWVPRASLAWVEAGRRRVGRGAAALGVVLLVLAAAPVARADDQDARQVLQQALEQVTASLDGEAAALEQLLAGPPVADAGWAAAIESYLADLDVGVWRWRIQVADALGRFLGPAAARVASGQSPSLVLPAVAAGDVARSGRVRPLVDAWEAYLQALDRVSSLEASLEDAASTGLAGLPPPGRTCPVDGPLYFSHTWGDPRPWGRTHKGEDIHAARGTPLVAMESGTIVQKGWHWEGGFGVYLKGYYTGDVYYYAHLSWYAPGIAVGARVEVGDLRGWVGSTGDAESPHLHLGWVPDNNGPWVDLTGLADPYPLLVGLCGPG
jgi:murein DD-endopeptidase MepM/ murein hydrolase activator NlpD